MTGQKGALPRRQSERDAAGKVRGKEVVAKEEPSQQSGLLETKGVGDSRTVSSE
jgi:hypothetical protein